MTSRYQKAVCTRPARYATRPWQEHAQQAYVQNLAIQRGQQVAGNTVLADQLLHQHAGQGVPIKITNEFKLLLTP